MSRCGSDQEVDVVFISDSSLFVVCENKSADQQGQRSIMDAFKWIKMSSFLILMLQCTDFSLHVSAAATRQVGRIGHEITLSCENLIFVQKCNSISWFFNALRSRESVTLFEHGQIDKKAGAKSDRLSVTADCSLIIKMVTTDDVGLYTCRHYKTGQQYEDSQISLTVIDIYEHENHDKIILFCYLLLYEHCEHRVEWLYEGKERTSSDVQTSSDSCSATVTFTTSHLNHKSKFYELLKCKVTDDETKTVRLFPFRPQSSGEKTGEGGTKTKSTRLLMPPKPTSAAESTKTTVTPNNMDEISGNKVIIGDTDNSISRSTRRPPAATGFPYFLRCIIVSVGLTALLMSAVTVNMWTNAKGASR